MGYKVFLLTVLVALAAATDLQIKFDQKLAPTKDGKYRKQGVFSDINSSMAMGS